MIRFATFLFGVLGVCREANLQFDSLPPPQAMRTPISTTAHWIVRITLSLIAIVVILLGYNYLHDEYANTRNLNVSRSRSGM